MHKTTCNICPKACSLAPGEVGDCRVRMNQHDNIVPVTYGHPCSIHIDPIEKKPLYHFLPGHKVLSMATTGCNLHCLHCQNWQISQADINEQPSEQVAPQELVELASEHQCPSIAYTYTDPIAYYEYALDTCLLAHDKGLYNILVTAAYSNPRPFRELCQVTDAANIDLKAFSDTFYQDICGATLKPVLTSLGIAKEMDVHLEVTNLIIPSMNDSDKMLTDLCRWIKQNLGEETPLHFSRFFPQYKLNQLPPTPEETLLRARKIAQTEGLLYVYIGNMDVQDGGTTACPKCHKKLIERSGYHISSHILKAQQCPICNTEIYGKWC